MKTKQFITTKTTLLSLLISLAVMPVLSLAADSNEKSLAFTQTQSDALEAVNSEEKLIRVRPASNHNQASAFQVAFSTEKNSYRVDERIRFRVRGNQQFFLYLFNIVPRTGRAMAILPNRYQTNRQLKYPAGNSWKIVPNANLEFYSDRPGTERIIMVASTRYIDVNKLKRLGNSKSAGDFFAMDTPLDALDSMLNETYSDELGSEKKIRVRSNNTSNPRLPKGVVIKEMRLRIR